MAINPHPVDDFSIEMLERHLQAACDLELWTIPLYLTATYSIIQPPWVSIPLLQEGEDGENVTKNVGLSDTLLSVAVQEMYHLQLASNLTSAFGFVPRMDAPSYDKLPHIIPNPDIPVGLGNAKQVIDLLIEVETPDTHVPPRAPMVDDDGELCYRSIGDLYNALRILVEIHQDKIRDCSLQQVQSTFQARYKVNSVEQYMADEDPKEDPNPNTAVNAIKVVVDEGEGMRGDGTLNQDEFTEPLPGSRFSDEDHISHYDRFMAIGDYLKDKGNDVQLYPCLKYSAKGAEQQFMLNVVYSKLLYQLRDSWKSPGPLQVDAMWVIKEAIINVLKQDVCPEFKELSRSEVNDNYERVVNHLDPNYLFRQLVPTGWTPSHSGGNNDEDWHACQGLNMCAGLGACDPVDPANSGGKLTKTSGTAPGDGYCATVVPHTCSGGNDCKYQGGCAYTSYNPAYNTGEAGSSGAGTGGCQTPISPYQMFADPEKHPPRPGQQGVGKLGESVWLQGRTNILARVKEKADADPEFKKMLEEKKLLENGVYTLACPENGAPNIRRQKQEGNGTNEVKTAQEQEAFLEAEKNAPCTNIHPST